MIIIYNWSWTNVACNHQQPCPVKWLTLHQRLLCSSSVCSKTNRCDNELKNQRTQEKQNQLITCYFQLVMYNDVSCIQLSLVKNWWRNNTTINHQPLDVFCLNGWPWVCGGLLIYCAQLWAKVKSEATWTLRTMMELLISILQDLRHGLEPTLTL